MMHVIYEMVPVEWFKWQAQSDAGAQSSQLGCAEPFRQTIISADHGGQNGLGIEVRTGEKSDFIKGNN
jgi:hypothetical protein